MFGISGEDFQEGEQTYALASMCLVPGNKVRKICEKVSAIEGLRAVGVTA